MICSTFPTWNSVVQDKPKESTNEHMGGEKDNNHLVQLFYAFKQRQHVFLLITCQHFEKYQLCTVSHTKTFSSHPLHTKGPASSNFKKDKLPQTKTTGHLA